MNSPSKAALKAKKKYSGALFVEHDEFDCFAEGNNDESSEETKNHKLEMIKSISRRESSHMGVGSGGKKYSKKLEDSPGPDNESAPRMPPERKLSQQGLNQIDQNKFNQAGYPLNSTNYTDMSKGFFPSAASKMGMNSIPTIPYLNSQSQSQGYQYQQPMFDQNMMYQPGDNDIHEYPTGSDFYSLSDEEIMQHFSHFLDNQQDCRLIQSRAEEKPYFFDMMFKHISQTFTDYCIDPSTTFLATKVVDLSAHDDEKLKQIVISFKGKVLQLCSDSYGTRVIQRVIEKTYNKQDIFEMLVGEIKDNVCMLVMCNNGNHVIQKLISQAKCTHIKWVYDEIIDRFKSLGVHKHGCCVIQRCIDNSNSYYKVGYHLNIRNASLKQLVTMQYRL